MNPTLDQANANAGLPKMSDVYGNIKAPSLSDIGGSQAANDTNINQGTTNAFNQYSSYAKSLPTASDTYAALEKQNGIPQLKATSQSLQGGVNDLENQIYRVTPNVSNNTSNSLVTDSQRQGMIAAQELPLQQQLTPQAMALGNINNEIGTAEQGIGNQVNAVNTNNQNLEGVAATGVTTAEDNAARSATGFSNDASNQLQGLLHKMDIQGTLDAADWATLSSLATGKQQYDAQIAQIKAKYLNGGQFQAVAPGNTLYNTNTGAHQMAPLPG